jgi:predicted DNA-binding transcriptional regulator AlpA
MFWSLGIAGCGAGLGYCLVYYGLLKCRQLPAEARLAGRIVLLTADGSAQREIMRRTGKSKTCVWRWQERFMQEGVDGLLRDKTRPPRQGRRPTGWPSAWSR